MAQIIRPSHAEILEFMMKTAHRAGDVELMMARGELRRRVLAGERLEQKASHGRVDAVTKPDKMSERHIFTRVSEFDRFASRIGEEGTVVLLDPQRGYMADPCDGSIIFSGEMQVRLQDPATRADVLKFSALPEPRDLNKYGVFLVYIQDGLPQVSYAYFPERHFGAVAVRGQGAWLRVRTSGQTIPLQANDAASLSDARTGVSFLRDIYNDDYLENYESMITALTQLPGERRFGFTSAIFESIATLFPKETKGSNGLALDRLDMYTTPQLFVWDHPWLHMSEAGASSVKVEAGSNGLEFNEFSYDTFDLFTGRDGEFNRPYGIITGGPRVVDAFVNEIRRL